MLVTLLAGHIAILLLWWCVVLMRRSIARLERKVEILSRHVHEAVERAC
jgi:hypothetical protein